MTKEDFRPAVYQVIYTIPSGKVASYGQVAQLAGLRNRARWVGTLLRKLPQDTQLPWHRVINSQGRLSLPEGSASHSLQKSRLVDEGVEFIGEKINMKVFGWRP